MIEFENVSKVYRGGTAAVHDFSLVIPSHRAVVLVGSSGSGKTTLLRMINRMVDPTDGRVLIDGQDVQKQAPVALRRSIGYVLQNGGLMPHRTVVDNVSTVPLLNHVPRKTARTQALDLLMRVGLDPERGNRYPAELSGGQQQRVRVARALASDPNILLMDKPFGAVDPIMRRELQDELRRLQADLDKTIVFVTHDIEEAFGKPHIGGPILGVATLLYAIPALPLLILIPALTGIALRSPVTMIIALSLYGIALLVRTAADALGSVGPQVREAAFRLVIRPVRCSGAWTCRLLPRF